MLPDITRGNGGSDGVGVGLEAATAMLSQLSVDELEALSARAQKVIKVKRALPTVGE